MAYIWLIPLLPGIGAAINGLVGIRSFSKQTAGLVACSTMGAALVLSVIAFFQLLGLPADARAYEVILADWIPPTALATADGIGRLHVTWGFRLDPLSGMMILVVTGIGTLIHVYSTAYMSEEPRGGVARTRGIHFVIPRLARLGHATFVPWRIGAAGVRVGSAGAEGRQRHAGTSVR